ncbi:sensor histidine kinase [Micromonospora sp. NPDC049230]|uniref:sensor histidine kinase n=1 Tax=Micromonospora sp. NPDC049230 TaxID=3155502 RepID=UPI0033C1705E
MRRDLPYALGGLILGALLLGNAALTPDATVGALDVALVAAMVVAVAACRRYPVVALGVITVAMLAVHIRVRPGVSAAFPVLGAVYVAGWRGHRVAAATASFAFLGGFLARDIWSRPTTGPARLIVDWTALMLGWFVSANIAGLVARQRRAYLEQVEQRAIEAERTREEMALRRAGEERLRIARDLHDSLTHSISVIKVQAGIAVHLARKHGEQPSATLLAIQEASSAAMRELRTTLDVLRSPADEDHVGLARVDELAERTRAAGVPVHVTVSGPPRDLPAEIDQAGYRVVQEALTNVARHAGPATAHIHVEYAPARLTVSVTDDGQASPAHPMTPGVGLRGMRERVTGLGGTLRAAANDDNGFTVRAAFPLEEPA